MSMEHDLGGGRPRASRGKGKGQRASRHGVIAPKNPPVHNPALLPFPRSSPTAHRPLITHHPHTRPPSHPNSHSHSNLPSCPLPPPACYPNRSTHCSLLSHTLPPTAIYCCNTQYQNSCFTYKRSVFRLITFASRAYQSRVHKHSQTQSFSFPRSPSIPSPSILLVAIEGIPFIFLLVPSLTDATVFFYSDSLSTSTLGIKYQFIFGKFFLLNSSKMAIRKIIRDCLFLCDRRQLPSTTSPRPPYAISASNSHFSKHCTAK